MADYTDLPTLKSALGITDSGRDELLTRAIAAACRAIDKRTGRTFGLAGTATARVFDPCGRVARERSGDVLLVDDIGSGDGLTVETGGGTWTAVTAYETRPGNALAKGDPVTGLLRVAGGWGSGGGRVRVTARWGWPAVPDDIELAARLQASRLYRRKDSPEGVAGSAEWGLMRLPRLDPDVQALVAPYELGGFA
ncbi:phage head-tail connector protein [Sphaerimonospora thailandensis]|uniref:Uncharacterized protein n=1 Tax=Sphaerimonospora thailandensis TaxID=795644 RepID=A0A8J3R8P2_9ACTN|nr:phage head-tail connector protein [Sphaerimonospora thailandensis]GIH69444.1 hypothetical protein Mth01_16970 [Sphaerimonospora thailandensis]